MKKYISLLLLAICLVLGISACQMPEYEYNGSSNPECPSTEVTGYSVAVFGSGLTDTQHPTFGVSGDRETFNSSWVTRKCTYTTSSPEIAVNPYQGEVAALNSCAMVVTATAEGTIDITYPAPIGDKTGTTIRVLYDENTGAVNLLPTN